MGVGNKQLALYAPLACGTTSPPSTGTLLQAAPSATAWWDSSIPAGLLGPGHTPATVWNSPGTALVDLTGNNKNLIPFHNPVATNQPQGYAHVSGMLGGAGFPTTTNGLLQPALDPASGWQFAGSAASATTSWTWYLVWSRPNWRQGTNFDTNPITLLTIGSKPILQVDSSGGTNRLVLFPGTGDIVVNLAMARRHTHCIIIRYSPATGADLWLDGLRVAQSEPWSPGPLSGPALLLHDGNLFGSAQCFFHEGGEWSQALSDTEVSALILYAGRWTLGVRKGLYFLFNGQSNAINYTMNDGAAALLAQGVAWYTGALAYNVLATTANAAPYTMQSGHGIYATSSGYPGSFVLDPGDGSSPSGWSLGPDGLAVRQAIAALPAEDFADICAIVWPWNETDSLRQYSEYATFEAAAIRFLALLRTMLKDTANKIPMIWWNGIPYGSADGITMHRQVVQGIASVPAQNVIIGNPQTSDSNPRGSSWDPSTGIATGGDPSHRDSADNLRFAMLAAPVVARTLMAGGYTDSIAAVPSSFPRVGGPTIGHVYMQSSKMLIVNVVHDGGNDIKIPLQAAAGAGFAVMDGGRPGADGTIVQASSCMRVDATHFQIALSTALTNAAGACRLFYPFGPVQIFRGNAVTDNFSDLVPPAGWDAGADLGSGWVLDFPLSATFSGIPLSATPV